jgi:hypothetical protein
MNRELYYKQRLSEVGMYNVFIIRASGEVEHTTQPKAPALKQLQEAVGGWIETVPYFHKLQWKGQWYRRGRAYANEEGILKGQPVNITASHMWKESFNGAYGLVGDVIFYAKGQS